MALQTRAPKAALQRRGRLDSLSTLDSERRIWSSQTFLTVESAERYRELARPVVSWAKCSRGHLMAFFDARGRIHFQGRVIHPSLQGSVEYRGNIDVLAIH